MRCLIERRDVIDLSLMYEGLGLTLTVKEILILSAIMSKEKAWKCTLFPSKAYFLIYFKINVLENTKLQLLFILTVIFEEHY